MAKVKKAYFCKNCGHEAPKWLGKCPACGEWNTFAEEIIARESGPAAASAAGPLPTAKPQRVSEIRQNDLRRIDLGNPEINRVLGGGLVPGSLVLLGGEPGIGKSTLSLQIALAPNGLKTLYVSGEESAEQIKMRASRLGIHNEECLIYAETLLENIVAQIAEQKPDVVVVDSIQTIYTDLLDSSAGSVSQIRECAATLLKYAKSTATSIFIIGHITKDGAIAGPKMLEHMVDAVLYFEGERHQSYRILRAVKNRYGSTNEIGVFEMAQNGLQEVGNPSLMMLSGRPSGISGTCVACVMEGSRPILAEVQALVSKSGFGTPRRMATGFDSNRAALLIAVLEKRAGYFFGNLDTYINVVGGLRLDETAADLPVAIALVSNLLDRSVADHIAAFGEIGLAGEVRSVSNIQQRVSESYRLGFTACIVPRHNLKGIDIREMPDIRLIGVQNISEAIKCI